MKTNEKPAIELYLYSLNQEFPVQKGHRTFLKRRSEPVVDMKGQLSVIEEVSANTFKVKTNDWSVQWLHNQWIENYTKIAGLEYPEKAVNPLTRLLIRQEDFGGIVFDPVNDRVYKVNGAGYKLLKEIMAFSEKGKIEDFKSKMFASDDVKDFIAFLKGAGLHP